MKIWNKFLTLLLSVVFLLAVVPSRDTRADDANFWNSLSTRYYYERLNADQQALYNSLSNKCYSILNGSETDPDLKIDVSNLDLSPREISDILVFFESDNPQYYFMIPSFSYYKNRLTGKVVAITNYMYDEFADGSYRSSTTNSLKNTINSWTSAIAQKAASAYDVDIETAAADYLCSKTVYDLNAQFDQSPVSAMLNGRTVCAGYSRTFALLMNYFNINTVCVASENHMWNVINLHGYWYCLDLTNDDRGSRAGHDIYNVTYANMSRLSSDYTSITDLQRRLMPSTDYQNGLLIKQAGGAYFNYGGNTYFVIDIDSALCKKIAGNGENVSSIPIADDVSMKVVNTPPTIHTSSGNPKADIRAFVDRLYTEVLGRDSEEDGANYWTNRLYRFEISGAQVAFEFIFSTEFNNKNVSDAKFVEILYRAFFNREFDYSGMDYWVSQLNKGVSRMNVAYGFIYSQEWADICATYGIVSGGTTTPNVIIAPSEATNSFVERLYTTALGRTFDADGRNYWAGRLANFDLTGEGAGVEFFLSPEFAGLNLSDDEFVERLYKTFMDRDSDADGKNFWLNQLRSGKSRKDVVYGFTRSSEFVDRCVEARIKPY